MAPVGSPSTWTMHVGSSVDAWSGLYTSSSSKVTGNVNTRRIGGGRRGTFTSVQTLIAAIEEYLAEYNRAPKRFVWTKDADMILAKVDRCKAALGTAH